MAYNNSTSTYSQYPNSSIFPVPVITLNVALLTALCAIQGKSGDEGDMQRFILDFLTAHGLTPHSDANGNITCTKGQADAYPCLVAHLDTVHTRYAGYTAALSTDGQILYACADSVEKVNQNLPLLSEPSTKLQVGVGGDDRCGLYVGLHLLTHLPACKVCFVVEEEIGMTKGSRFVDMAFFDDAAIVLQCDRKGHDDWVQTVSGTQVSGNVFIESIRDLLTHHKYTVTQHGGPTDVGALKSRGLGVVAANMSCGYYNPHSSTETIFLPALENTLNLCLAVLQRVGYVKQLHAHVPYKAPVNHYQQHESRWDERQGYRNSKLPVRDPFGAMFSTMEYGWSWLSADEIDNKHGVKGLKMGGFCKVVNDKLVGPYQLSQIKDYERELAEDATLAAVDAQAKLVKDAKKALKAWITEDGSWEHNKLKGTDSQWVKWISDGGANDLLYPVAYAKLMTDIPVVEKEFRFQWDGCYGPDAQPTAISASDEIMFSAETISKFVHEVLEEQATKLAEKEARSIANQHQLPFDDGSAEYDEVSYVDFEGKTRRVTKTFKGGQLILTSVRELGTGELVIDAITIQCPDCRTDCVMDEVNGGFFYCEACKEWVEDESVADDNMDDDVYSRYLGKNQGQWRDSHDAYERAYGRD